MSKKKNFEKMFYFAVLAWEWVFSSSCIIRCKLIVSHIPTLSSIKNEGLYGFGQLYMEQFLCHTEKLLSARKHSVFGRMY